LIKHLDDKRPTKITIKHEGFFGGMFFPDEYDYNQRTTKEPPAGVNRRNRDGGDGDSHTVTVGDLCFVALGQIVNRHFSAVRYQPTACIMINSPTRSEALRSAIKKEWGTLTPEQHKASLIRDFREPDHQERRRGACVRLAYFYPDVMEALVLKQLAEPTYDVFEVQELIRDKLYRAKDAKERKSLFDAFLAKRGTVARQGVLLYLFEDLDTQEADEEKRISPPLKEKYAARACLVELFDYPKDVKSKDRPHISPVEDSEQARFIETLIHDKCRKIGDVVKALFLENANDDYFAPACLRCLANRGYADFLLEQLAKIDPAVSEGTRLYETYIEAITTSDEPSVRAKLFDLLKRRRFPRSIAHTIRPSARLPASCWLSCPATQRMGRACCRSLVNGFRRKPNRCTGTSFRREARIAPGQCALCSGMTPWAKELLAPLLDDKRELTGFTVPMRVCDRAAQAISHTTEDIRFDTEWTVTRKDEVIERLKRYCKRDKS
jgi:hypothetical protein